MIHCVCSFLFHSAYFIVVLCSVLCFNDYWSAQDNISCFCVNSEVNKMKTILLLINLEYVWHGSGFHILSQDIQLLLHELIPFGNLCIVESVMLVAVCVQMSVCCMCMCWYRCISKVMLWVGWLGFVSWCEYRFISSPLHPDFLRMLEALSSGIIQ